MANAGDSFTVELKPSHIAWGTYRHTNTREPISGEGYIPIPLRYAEEYNVYNSNYRGDVLGFNLFNCTSAAGESLGRLKAAGGKGAGEIYAKQFQGDGDLKVIGRWFRNQGAKVGDRVQIIWTSPTDIIIELL